MGRDDDSPEESPQNPADDPGAPTPGEGAPPGDEEPAEAEEPDSPPEEAADAANERGEDKRPQSEPKVDAEVNVHIGTSNDSRIEATGIKLHQYFSGLASGEAPWRKDLTREDCDALRREQLLGMDASFVVASQDLEPVVKCVERHRLALIVGERGLGKGALTQVAAGQIAGRDGSVREARISSSLERGMRARLGTLFGGDKSFDDCILVIEDAFDRGNEDLSRLVENLDEPRLDALRGRLTAAKSYLLMSSDTERLPGRIERLRDLGVLIEVTPPPEEVLLQLLHQRVQLRQVSSGRKDPKLDTAVMSLLDTKGETLARRLRSTRRMVEFVDNLLEPVARGDLSLENAIERLDNLEQWLLTDLREDPAVWSFVLALVLASTDPRTRWVPWFHLHRLWRQVEALVDKELGREEESGRPVTRLIVDRQFLARARAEARRLPYPQGEAVRFEDPSMADRLWGVLLGSGRSILAAFEPQIRKLAEGAQLSSAVLASRALGRIGELDPAGVFLSRMNAWLDREDDSYRFEWGTLVGEMLVGASGSQDEAYFSTSLDRLKGAVEHASPESARRAMAAFVPVGAALPESVIDILWRIARNQLSKPVKEVAPLSPTVARSLEALAAAEVRKAGERRVVLDPQEAEDAVLDLLGQRPKLILEALQFVLVGLSFGGESTRVVQSMARWIRSDQERLAPWIAFLLLRGRGVFGILEDFPLRPPPDGTNAPSGGSSPCSRILLAAQYEEEVESITDLLEVAYEASGAFPLALRAWLRGNLVRVLEGWLRQGARTDLIRPQVVSLFSRVQDSRDEALRKQVFELLQGTARDQEVGVQELALEIMRASAPGSGVVEVASKSRASNQSTAYTIS